MALLTILAQYHDNDHMDGAWGWVMGVFMALVLVAVVALVVWLVRSTQRHHGHPQDRDETAMDILDRRLASGEITPEEHRERAEILRRR